MKSSTKLTFFVDSTCPLCSVEQRWLCSLDTEEQIEFVDISSDSFDASTYGKKQEDFEVTLQGRSKNGTWVEGLDVFREAYSTLGFQRLVTCSRISPFSNVLELLYFGFKLLRVPLGRCVNFLCRIRR